MDMPDLSPADDFACQKMNVRFGVDLIGLPDGLNGICHGARIERWPRLFSSYGQLPAFNSQMEG
jgi:hypothetical protein